MFLLHAKCASNWIPKILYTRIKYFNKRIMQISVWKGGMFLSNAAWPHPSRPILMNCLPKYACEIVCQFWICLHSFVCILYLCFFILISNNVWVSIVTYLGVWGVRWSTTTSRVQRRVTDSNLLSTLWPLISTARCYLAFVTSGFYPTYSGNLY